MKNKTNNPSVDITNNPVVLAGTIEDWRKVEGEGDDMVVGDEQPYRIDYQMGNQSYLDIFKQGEDEPSLQLVVEISNGVPALSIAADGSDMLLHIHCVNGQLVLTPEDSLEGYQSAPSDRYSYHCANAVTLGERRDK